MNTEALLSQVYNDHLDCVYGFFYYRTASRHIAEDLTSSTFLIFVDKVRNAASISDPEKYLYGIMKKVWLRHLQNKYRQQEVYLESIDDFDAYVAEHNDSEAAQSVELRVERYISQLPSAQQIVMRMRLIEQKTLQEICSELQKDMNYVKTTQKRGIATLKKLLEQYPELAGENS